MFDVAKIMRQYTSVIIYRTIMSYFCFYSEYAGILHVLYGTTYPFKYFFKFSFLKNYFFTVKKCQYFYWIKLFFGRPEKRHSQILLRNVSKSK